MKKSYQRTFTRASFAGLLLAAGATAAHAQTSGTLSTQLTATTNYSTAPWTITSGPSTYPDGGGVATLNSQVNTIIGTVAGGSALTIDVSPTLSGITFNSPYSYNLAAGTGTSIIADNTAGLTLNTTSTAVNTITSFILTNVISSPISGGGTAGLIKTGSGIVELTGASTYTGGTHINGGELVVGGSAAVGDNVFGATGAGNGLSFNGGSLFQTTTGGLTTARDIFVDAGGALLYLSTAMTANGVISGTGTLNIYGFAAAGTMTLTNTNTYTGATITSGSSVSTLTLSGNGSIAASSSYDLAGTLNLDNSGTTGVNRLGDSAAIASRGATLNLTGNAANATTETVGALTLAGGTTTLNVTPGTAGSTLALAGIARQNNSTLLVRGAGLGGTPGAGVATITTGSTSPTIIGGGGATTTSTSIVPWAVGNTSTTALTNSSLVTYSPTTGFRPLATTEYTAAFGGSATDNVRLTAATANVSAVTANSLVVATSGTTALTGAGTINVTSGAVLFSTGTVTQAGTVAAPLNFGSAEGVISSTNTGILTLSSTLSGTGGVTFNSPNAGQITISGANTYTGTTTLTPGTYVYTGSVAGDGSSAGPFGQGTSAIVLNAGTAGLFLEASAANTFNRDLLVTGGPGSVYFGTVGNTALTMNGNIALQGHDLVLYGSTAAATGTIYNGTISGTGALRDAATYNFLNGNNTYSGGTNISTGTFVAGSDTAFGTGTINFSGNAGTITGSGTAARTLANNLVFGAVTTSTVFGGSAPLNFTGAVNLNGARTLNVSNTALTSFSGVVSSGAVTKTGTGAVAFNSPTGNTFTGGFVNTGVAATASAIYANNSSGSAFGAGAVSIGAASATVFSTLAGSFTTNGATSIAGRLSPGNTSTALTAGTAGIGAIGTTNFNSNLTLSSATTSSLYLEIASRTSHDQINVGGAFTLNGTITLATIGGFSLSAGTTVDFIDFGSIVVGTYTLNTTGVTLDPGVTLDTSRFAIDGSITAVPEPTTLACFGVAGALGLAGYFRRRRSVLWS